MANKFEKNTNCEYCGKDLNATYRNKRFCDDKCRIYFKRELSVKIEHTPDLPAEVDWYKSAIITTENPKEATVIVTKKHSGETKKFKVYDYSSIPEGIPYSKKKALMAKLREEQDKQ